MVFYIYVWCGTGVRVRCFIFKIAIFNILVQFAIVLNLI